MSTDIKKELRDRLEDTNVGMLSAGSAPAVPMSHYYEEDDPTGALWFITAKTTDLAQAAVTATPSTFIVCAKDESLYTRIEGTLSLSEDKAKLDEIWSAMAAAWFEEGKEDPDVQLMRFDPREAEVWLTGNSAKFMYEIAKANMAETTPDVGEHGTVRF